MLISHAREELVEYFIKRIFRLFTMFLAGLEKLALLHIVQLI